MSEIIRSIRGMNDILPHETPYWQKIEQQLRELLASYGYQEIRFPIVEKTALFSRSIGEVTDIVEKEMYSFTDRNGDGLTLRPEGTAGCLRAAIEHGLLQQSQRLWYLGPMFRHERPQKGRYRQFHQLGVETYGFSGPDIDAELILMTAKLWQQLGLSDNVSLQINSLGTVAAREAYKTILVQYYKGCFAQLDEDSQRRLQTNPLRILDSKNPAMQAINQAAPQLIDYLDASSQAAFTQLCHYLDQAGVNYQVTPSLVRGLDYYSQTVFEWVTTQLGAQGTICAGGRYDGLISQLGGKPNAAMGFAIGIERLIALLKDSEALAISTQLDAYLVAVGEKAQQEAILFSENLRNKIPSFRLSTHCGGGSFKSQFKQADRSRARWALILGEQEVDNKTIGVKEMNTGQQVEVSWEQLPQYLQSQMDK